MDLFDEDNDGFGNIDSIMREFLGTNRITRERERRESKFISGEEDERKIDFVETDEKIFIIFEFPGLEKKDLNIDIKGDILKIKSKKQEINIQKSLPKNLNLKKFNNTMINGVLEITIDKK